AVTALHEFVSSHSGSTFRKNFVRVAKANVLVQAISLLFAPILSRLYSPADYGVLAVFSSLLGLLAAFATWRFDWSIPNARSRVQAVALLVLGLGALGVISIVAFAALHWGPSGDEPYREMMEGVAPFIALLPLALLGTGV